MTFAVQFVVRKEITLACYDSSLCACLPRPVASYDPNTTEGSSVRRANPINSQSNYLLGECSTAPISRKGAATTTLEVLYERLPLGSGWSRRLSQQRIESAGFAITTENNDAFLSANAGGDEGDETSESHVTGVMDLPPDVFKSRAETMKNAEVTIGLRDPGSLSLRNSI